MSNKDDINKKEEILFVNESLKENNHNDNSQSNDVLGKINPKKVSQDDINQEKEDNALQEESIAVINTRLKLSGSVSRLLSTKTMIKFILDSDSNWYEV